MTEMGQAPLALRALPGYATGWKRLFLPAVAILSMAAVALASIRHTGSLAFPIDDGYIYSNYVLSAAQGHPFTYNPGELSGGITSLVWYFLCLAAYILVAPFHDLLAGLAPPGIQANIDLARQAGHIYISAYLVGVVSLAATALGVRRLADIVLPSGDIGNKKGWRSVFVWLLGVVAAADVGLVWGAMSGLESTFAAGVAVWAVCLLLEDVERDRLRWSLMPAALLPWARPDLLAIGAACLCWLGLRAALYGDKSKALANLLTYTATLVAGAGAMSLGYYLGWGQPLPSSFYAKVGGLRIGPRFFSSAQELVVAKRYLPFIVGLAALLGGVSSWLTAKGKGGTESRMAALLLLLVSLFYTVAVMSTLPWFGQEDRYLLPIHPFVILLCGLLVWNLARRFLPEAPVSFRLAGYGLAMVAIAFVVTNYVWATRNYVVEVRNIHDAHALPAQWLAQNTPNESVIASEPIGAVKLFSGRRTVDLVGLTTPATLGTYRNWPLAWERLRLEGASYLLFYPAWFDGRAPPAWAVETARFTIPDNKIAGDSVIAIYRLDWTKYTHLK